MQENQRLKRKRNTKT